MKRGIMAALLLTAALRAQTPVPGPMGSGGSGAFPSIACSAIVTTLAPGQSCYVTYTAQTGNLSFDLSPSSLATGTYLLVDSFSITTPDANTFVGYTVSYESDLGAVSPGRTGFLAGDASAAFGPGVFGLASINVGPLAHPTGLTPFTIQAITSTPIHVAISMVPSVVATAGVTAGNKGLLYTAGDTVSIDGGGDPGTAIYTIDTVGVGGDVLTGHISNGGDSYAISTGNTTTNVTVTNPAAAGLELDILTMVPSVAEYTYRATLIRLSTLAAIVNLLAEGGCSNLPVQLAALVSEAQRLEGQGQQAVGMVYLAAQ